MEVIQALLISLKPVEVRQLSTCRLWQASELCRHLLARGECVWEWVCVCVSVSHTWGESSSKQLLQHCHETWDWWDTHTQTLGVPHLLRLTSVQWWMRTSGTTTFVGSDRHKFSVEGFHKLEPPNWNQYTWSYEKHEQSPEAGGGLTCIWRCFLSAGWRHCRKGWFLAGRPLTWLFGVFFHSLWPERYKCKIERQGKTQTVHF